ncbi:ATP-binding protein [Streptomyces sp. x-80]|uniref:ATP-binding protein n=1 Tax=Streptomyces sp. x-80 TaxID=2789282 RepID=UPI003980AD21
MSRSAPPPLRNSAIRFVVPNSALAPKITRDLVATLLVVTGRPTLVDTARVCVSEVITNVRLHTRTTLVYLDITLCPGRVAVAVWDDEWDKRPSETAVYDFHSDEERGRGLLLVQTLSAGWGVTWPADGDPSRKRVWFVLDEPAVEAVAA